MMNYAKYLVDAHRPAMEQADKTSLPQTVFYHPDWLFSNAEAGARILRHQITELYVTWLPNRYFIK